MPSFQRYFLKKEWKMFGDSEYLWYLCKCNSMRELNYIRLPF